MSMARIRTIKPEFFTSADICDLTPLTRLVYISLWCEADREGKLIWNQKTIKLRFFPADNKDEFNESISELLDSDLIEIYKIDGKEYCIIPSFTKHQVINNRETDSKLPNPPRDIDASGTRESGVLGEGKGKERKGKERKEITPAAVEKKHYAFEGEKIKLNQKDFDRAKELFPNLDLVSELNQLDFELREEKSWFSVMNAKLNYRNSQAKAKPKLKSVPMVAGIPLDEII
jgi:hypothetical protein